MTTTDSGRITAGSSTLGSSVEDGNGDSNVTDDEGSDLGSAAAAGRPRGLLEVRQPAQADDSADR